LIEEAYRESERRYKDNLTVDYSISEIEANRSEIEANREIAEYVRSERIAREQQLKREAEERYWNSPEGIRQRQKEYARAVYIRKKIITFFWLRPVDLIRKWLKSNSEPVNYKNYISFAVWVIWILVPLYYGSFGLFLLLFPFLPAITIFLMYIFYFLQFEMGYYMNS
jgi:hypothetical protein